MRYFLIGVISSIAAFVVHLTLDNAFFAFLMPISFLFLIMGAVLLINHKSKEEE